MVAPWCWMLHAQHDILLRLLAGLTVATYAAECRVNGVTPRRAAAEEK